MIVVGMHASGPITVVVGCWAGTTPTIIWGPTILWGLGTAHPCWNGHVTYGMKAYRIVGQSLYTHSMLFLQNVREGPSLPLY